MSELEQCPFQKPGETHDVRFIELKPGYGQSRWEAVTNPRGEVTEFMCECGCCMGYIPSFCPLCGARVVVE